MITQQVSFPLDDEGYFRRECPLCRQEFKVLLREDELGLLRQLRVDDFLVGGQETSPDEEEDDTKATRFCPYCGQPAPEDEWWTQEQLAYIGIFAKNIMAGLLNEQLIRPLRNTNHGGIVRIEAKEMKKQDPWISPETSDLTRFDLPCCGRSIKIDERPRSEVHCFFCGFPHKAR